jgi:hypothetical protein
MPVTASFSASPLVLAIAASGTAGGRTENERLSVPHVSSHGGEVLEPIAPGQAASQSVPAITAASLAACA